MEHLDSIIKTIKAEFRQPYSKDREPLISLLPLKQPLTMYIDPSNICNFKCSFCFQDSKKAREEMNFRQMSLDTFKTILNQLAEFNNPIKMVHLHGFGEPMLNPQFAEFILLAKKARVANRIATTSNASLLTKELSQAIIESGLDQIHFSIYGLNDSNYRAFSKAKIDFSQIIDNIKYFYEYKSNYAKLHGHNVHVHIKMNMDYFSKQDQARFLELFGNYADSIYLDGVANIWPGIDFSNSLSINLSSEFNQSKSKLSHQYGHTITNNAICPIVFYQLLIHSNGDISPCCADFQAKMTLGNVSSTTIKQVWESALLQKNNNLLDVDSTNNSNQNCLTKDSAYSGGGGGGNPLYLQNTASMHIPKTRQAA